MKFYFPQLHNHLRVFIAVFVLTALVVGNFCFSFNTALAHNENAEVMVELSPLDNQTDKECCHGTFHNENHESAKITVGNKQINNQADIIPGSFSSYLNNTNSSHAGLFEYYKNVKEDANPPNSILRC